MNERIRELAEQAGFGSAWFEESSPGYPALPKEGMLKEFAELIVRECARRSYLEDSRNPEVEEALEFWRKDMLKHFGVEE